MDRRERADDLQASILAALQGFQSGVWTAMPGIVKNVSRLGTEQTVDVQPSIMGQVQREDMLWDDVVMPLCIHCPAIFPFGSLGGVTFPVSVGDECLLVFASRCIDGWWEQGGVAKQAEYRMHDLSDGFAVLGVASKPKRMAAYQPGKIELRDATRSSYMSLDPATGQIDVKTSLLRVEGPAQFVGNTQFTGTMTANGVNVGSTHRHSTSTNPSGTPT